MNDTPLAQRIKRAFYIGTKRTLDATVAAALIVLLAPVLVLIALAVFLEDAGPVLYYQTRVGKDGTLFRFYKFRALVWNLDAIKAQQEARNEAVGPIFKMQHDPRVTRVGRVLRKYSLDELPQLFNVLRGEMSLVGPRPRLPKEVECYTEQQLQGLTVQPGLLSLPEGMGRRADCVPPPRFWIKFGSLFLPDGPFCPSGCLLEIWERTCRTKGRHEADMEFASGVCIAIWHNACASLRKRLLRLVGRGATVKMTNVEGAEMEEMPAER